MISLIIIHQPLWIFRLPIVLLLSPTGYNTLATEIWSATEAGAYGRAAAPALLLLGIRRVPAPERIAD